MVAAEVGLELADDVLEIIAERPEHGRVVVAAAFLTGLELGARMGLVAPKGRLRRFIKELVHSGPDMPPLEVRERDMAADIDLILEVAAIADHACPDCGSEPLYDEDTGHLVCAGCGQLLREP